jgi:hypothetical protein
VEWILKGGFSGKLIFLNCPGWSGGDLGQMVLVDGKQRINAVQRFMNNEIKVFGYFFNEYEDRLRSSQCDFIFNVNDLKTEKEVLEWYLSMNSGGTPHSQEDLDKVKNMIHKIEKESE